MPRPGRVIPRPGLERVTPLLEAKRRARERNPRTFDPTRRARRVSSRNAKGRPVRKPETCKPTPPAARDNLSGWFIYYCGKGVLLVPSARCVGPECRGAKPGETRGLGYAGDLDAGSRGAFFQGGRLPGTLALDGVEIAKGVAELEGLRQDGAIDGYYAAAAKNAFLESMSKSPERAAPFAEPTPIGRLLAPGAMSKMFAGRTGEEVGPSVTEACRCTPREPDARDPVSGWLIYYIGDGVLLTPTKKCIGGGGRRPSFWRQTWRNVSSLVPFVPPPPSLPPYEPPPRPPEQPTVPNVPPPPPRGYLCLDPRIWPGGFRPQPTPCEPPKIEYGGP